jgi:hypothetical protein
MAFKEQLILVVFCLCVPTGCGKKDTASAQNKSQPTPEQAVQIESEYILPANKATSATPPPATRPNAASPSPGQPRPTAVQLVQPIQERINGAIHAPLTMQLRMYIEKNGRMPQTFSEFANSAMDTVPPVPEGMKFVLDPVDKAVKVVKK